MKEWKEIVTVAHKACQLYQEYGSPDTAALSLDKAGKIISDNAPRPSERSLEELIKASI